MLNAVVLVPWKMLHVPPEDTVSARHWVMDSARISPVGVEQDAGRPVAGAVVGKVTLSCWGEGAEYQGLGCVGSGLTPVRHHE